MNNLIAINKRCQLNYTASLLDVEANRFRIDKPTHADIAQIQLYFSRMSIQSRRLRFHATFDEVPESILAMYHIGRRKDLHTWVIRDNMQAQAIVGETMLSTQTCSLGAEIALSIDDNYHNRGIGRSAIVHLMKHAKLKGLTFVYCDVLRENTVFRALMKSLDFTSQRNIDDSRLVRMSAALHSLACY